MRKIVMISKQKIFAWGSIRSISMTEISCSMKEFIVYKSTEHNRRRMIWKRKELSKWLEKAYLIRKS